MRLRNLMAMISSRNDYSNLKWPLTMISVLITSLAFILLLSFRSHAWFSFKSTDLDNQTATPNTTLKQSHMVSYGSFGLWLICVGNPNNTQPKCDTWTKRTRPQNFGVLVVLVTCALLLANLTIFPAWAATILIIYNANNRYIRHIMAFTWVLLVLTLTTTALLICAMILIGLTKFFAPASFTIGTIQLNFYSGPGVYYILFSTITAVICFLLVVIALIWKQMIEMGLNNQERDLLRQLSDDNYQPGWHKVIKIPRKRSDNGHNHGEPPPYNHLHEETNS